MLVAEIADADRLAEIGRLRAQLVLQRAADDEELTAFQRLTQE